MKVIAKCNGSYAGVNLVKGKELTVSGELGNNLIDTNKAKAAKLPKEGFIKFGEKDAKSKVSKGL